MKNSNNPKVQSFLEDMQDLSPDKNEILQALREIVLEIYPEVEERIIYGGIMFTIDEDFGGIFPSKKHVSFEFTQGFTFKDPNKNLEGTGKYRRHLKIHSLEEIKEKEVEFYVKQAV